MTENERRILLTRIHQIRIELIWGKKADLSRFAWPVTDADWRQTDHGAPWDSNVQMAELWLKAGQRLADEGLVTI